MFLKGCMHVSKTQYQTPSWNLPPHHGCTVTSSSLPRKSAQWQGCELSGATWFEISPQFCCNWVGIQCLDLNTKSISGFGELSQKRFLYLISGGDALELLDQLVQLWNPFLNAGGNFGIILWVELTSLDGGKSKLLKNFTSFIPTIIVSVLLCLLLCRSTTLAKQDWPCSRRAEANSGLNPSMHLLPL